MCDYHDNGETPTAMHLTAIVKQIRIADTGLRPQETEKPL